MRCPEATREILVVEDQSNRLKLQAQLALNQSNEKREVLSLGQVKAYFEQPKVSPQKHQSCQDEEPRASKRIKNKRSNPIPVF
jgi:hypothetical protein